MVLLLDQISRNVSRDLMGQALVYGRYDCIARTLLHCILDPTLAAKDEGDEEATDIIGTERLGSNEKSVARRIWFYVPLTHSKDMEDHEL